MSQTLTPRPDQGSPREVMSARPASAPELMAWLRGVLDRPLTSYHLVLGAVSLLLVVGVMMVLSASSVNAYVTYDDSYYYVKRQLVFLGDRRDRRRGDHEAARPDPARAGLGRRCPGRGAADPDLHPARHQRERQPELALPRFAVLRPPAGRVRQAGDDRLGGQRAGPQAAAAGPAQAPAGPVPAGQRAADAAGGLPGRRRYGGGDGRDRGRDPVDRRGPAPGAGRPGRGRGRRRGRDVRQLARSGCAGWPRSWTRR